MLKPGKAALPNVTEVCHDNLFTVPLWQVPPSATVGRIKGVVGILYTEIKATRSFRILARQEKAALVSGCRGDPDRLAPLLSQPYRRFTCQEAGAVSVSPNTWSRQSESGGDWETGARHYWRSR